MKDSVIMFRINKIKLYIITLLVTFTVLSLSTHCNADNNNSNDEILLLALLAASGNAASNSEETTSTSERRIFVSASTTTGNIGGVAGGNALCNADANRPDTNASYIAILTTAEIPAVLEANATYIRASDGQVIGVTDGSGRLPRPLTEAAIQTSAQFVWVNDDSASGLNCSSWTNSSSGSQGGVGQANSMANWYNLGPSSCDTSYPLYCAEQ